MWTISPSVLAAAARHALSLQPSSDFARAARIWTTAILAASIGCLGLQPLPSLAQAKPDRTPPKDRVAPAAAPASAPSMPARKSSGTAPPVPAQAGPSEAAWPERLVWDKEPLRIALGVGPERERSITFPAAMHIGVPQELAPLLRLQTVGRTTYVTALAPFARSRIVAEDRATGAVVLLDLTAAKDNISTQPVTVVAAPSADRSDPRETVNDAQAPIDMVTLTRFAAQQMYAPRRLVVAHPGIRRVIVEQAPVSGFYVGAGLRATPAGQWRGDDFYVTAVVLENQLPQPIELNPLDVRGHWRAITFHHGRLLAKGSEADTTVVYLVCERPFNACR